MAAQEPQPVPGGAPGGRERVERAAYELFSRRGVRAVGVDTVISAANVAKMTLYRNFDSKDELVLAFLRRREELWTKDWVRAEATRRGNTPRQRLLAIFEIFDEWFREPEFEGCSFITTMLEFADRSSPVRQASVSHLAEIRAFLRELATAAGAPDPDSFARQWHLLMKGSIIAAGEGDTEAALRAKELGLLLLRERGMTD
ncbi:MAG TPA: TetR/AcrR family transcriptional regulator [Pseudonocardia sp.]|nr:TetR/AcrR family transcriptional regulator [Pseudonocardia sp.]